MRDFTLSCLCGFVLFILFSLMDVKMLLKEIREELHSARAQEQTCGVGNE